MPGDARLCQAMHGHAYDGAAVLVAGKHVCVLPSCATRRDISLPVGSGVGVGVAGSKPRGEGRKGGILGGPAKSGFRGGHSGGIPR